MKRALVTGSAAGLGRALTERLLADGWAVVGVDRDPINGVPRDAPLASEGGDVTPAYSHALCDLANEREVDRLLVDLGSQPPFELIILAAGISATGRFERIPAEAHSRVLAVNAAAPLIMADAMLDGLIAPGGRLVLIGSLASDVGYPGAASYAASKDALAIYARSIAKRARARGVSVLTVLPGPIRTDHAARHAPPGARADRRMAPDDLARRILAARGGTLRPGAGARLGGLLGRVAPALSTRLMRRALFEKLDREVW